MADNEKRTVDHPIDASQKPQEVSGKYANPEKANSFRKKFPDLKATNKEIEEASISVYWNKENGFNNLDKAWTDPKFQELIANHITRLRKLKDSDNRIEAELSGEKVSWKYANPEKANSFRKTFQIEATDQEVEQAASSVYWNKENGFDNLDKAWADSRFQKLMVLSILENKK